MITDLQIVSRLFKELDKKFMLDEIEYIINKAGKLGVAWVYFKINGREKSLQTLKLKEK